MMDEENDVCCICLSDQEPRLTTSCNHCMCRGCAVKLHELNPHKVLCPMCRRPLSSTDLQQIGEDPTHTLTPFDPSQYPLNPDWSFITSLHDRSMIQSAYEAIHQADQWRYLHDFALNETQGFMMCRDPVMLALMQEVDRYGEQGHSGLSMCFTMHRMRFIARYGFHEYKICAMTQ